MWSARPSKKSRLHYIPLHRANFTELVRSTIEDQRKLNPHQRDNPRTTAPPTGCLEHNPSKPERFFFKIFLFILKRILFVCVYYYLLQIAIQINIKPDE